MLGHDLTHNEAVSILMQYSLNGEASMRLLQAFSLLLSTLPDVANSHVRTIVLRHPKASFREQCALVLEEHSKLTHGG